MSPSEDSSSRVSVWLERLAWCVVPLSILLIDFEIRREFQHSVFFFPVWFLTSVFVSWLGWFCIVVLVRGTRARFVVIPLFVITFALMAFITWGSVLERHFSITPNEVLYLLEEPGNGVSLISDAWTWGSALGFLVVATLWIVMLLRSAVNPTTRLFRGLAAAGLVFTTVFVMTLPSIFVMPWTPYPSDIRSAFVLWEGVRDYAAGERSMSVGAATRKPVEKQAPFEGPSILLIVGESMRVTHMSSLWEYERETTPNLQRLTSRKTETFLFEKHVPNSAASYWATTGIFTGKYPKTSRVEIRESPAIWQYAKSVSYATFIVSSQSWAWAKLSELWLDPPPDHFADIDTLGLPITNDTGTDDVLIAEWLATQLESDKFKRPFFGVFQTNSTHWPFVESPNSKWERDEVGKFDAATLRTDEAIGKLIEALEKNGELDDTIIILTADHAESLPIDMTDEEREDIDRREPALFHGARVGSCEPVYVNAPMMIFIPEKWQEKLAIDPEVLTQNRGRVTSHTDIFATIADIFDVKTENDGLSMFKEIPTDRVAYCFTTPQWATREISGIGARQGDRFMYTRTNLSQPYFYDLNDGFRRRLPKEKPPWADSLQSEVDKQAPVPEYLDHALKGIR